MSLHAGIDIGASHTKACLIDDERILVDARIPTDLLTMEDTGRLAVDVLTTVLADAGRDLDSVASVGVGVPGQVTDGVVRNAANLGIDDSGFDLGGYISSATQVGTVVENDTRAAAYGAYVLAASGGLQLHNLVYIGLGTGVSAGAVLDGMVYRGSRGLAGEFGHVSMGTGIQCPCGSVGCLETVIGAPSLRYARDGEQSESVFQSAAGGDLIARGLAERAIDHLARAMWWLAAAFDPDLFFIGGGVGAGNPSIRSLLVTRWEEIAGHSHLARRVLDPDRVRMYDLGEPVGAYGAALLSAVRPNRSGKREEKAIWEEETIP